MRKILSPLQHRWQRIHIPVWCDVLVVGICVVLFCVITLPALGSNSSYFDEGYSAYLAHLTIPQAVYYTSLDVHPPLYYIALHGWTSVFGDTITVLRSLSVFWGCVSIVFAFLIAGRAFGRRTAWTMLPFFVLSPLFIRYSETARMYTMALALGLAATYILIMLRTSRHVRKRVVLWVLYGVIVAAGMWTNYFTALIWLGHAAWLAYEHYVIQKKLPWEIAPVKGWLGAMILAVILYIPWIPALLLRYGDIQNNGFWIKPFSIDTLASTLTTGTLLLPAHDTTGWLAIGLIVWTVIVVWLIARTYRQLDGTKKPLFRLIMFLSFGPIIFLILLSLPPFRPAYTYRYALAGVCISMMLIGISLALVQFKKRALIKKLTIGVFLIGILMIGVVNVFHQGSRNLDTGAKNMLGEIIKKVNETTSSIEPIIIMSPYAYYAASVYETPSHPVYYLYANAVKGGGVTRGLVDMPDRRSIKNVDSFVKKYTSIWIVSEDKAGTTLALPPAWQKTRSMMLNDPDRGTPTAYALQFRAQ